MESEKDTGGSNGTGRRSTDSKNSEEVLSPSGSSFRSRLFTWFLAFGGVAALIATGRASHVLDTAVATNLKQDEKLEIIITQLHKNDIEQNRLLLTLENNIIQQNKSDAEFLGVIRPIKNELGDIKKELREIDSGVRMNNGAITIINERISRRDNTRVNYLASR